MLFTLQCLLCSSLWLRGVRLCARAKTLKFIKRRVQQDTAFQAAVLMRCNERQCVQVLGECQWHDA